MNCSLPYNYNASQPSKRCQDAEFPVGFIIVEIFLAILAVLGILANICVIVVYSKKKKSSTSTILIFALSVTDLTICLTVMPITLAKDIIEHLNDYEKTEYILNEIHRFMLVFMIGYSTAIIACIAIDRYYAICRPLSFKMTRGKTTTLLTIFFIFCLLLSTVHKCGATVATKIVYITCYSCNLLVLLVCYGKVFYAVYHRNTVSPIWNTQGERQANSEQVSKVVKKQRFLSLPETQMAYFREELFKQSNPKPNKVRVSCPERTAQVPCSSLHANSKRKIGTTSLPPVEVTEWAKSETENSKKQAFKQRKDTENSTEVEYMTLSTKNDENKNTTNQNSQRTNKGADLILNPEQLMVKHEINRNGHVKNGRKGVSVASHPCRKSLRFEKQEPKSSTVHHGKISETAFSNSSHIFMSNDNHSGTRKRKSHIQTAKMLILVTVVFIITWIPPWIIALGNFNITNSGVEFLSYTYFLNSICNPFIYSLVNKRFRKNLTFAVSCQTRSQQQQSS